MLVSDWSRKITWPECWSLIGRGRSRDLNAGLWLDDVGTDPRHTSITCQFEPCENMTSNSVDTGPAVAVSSDWSRPLIGQMTFFVASTNSHGLQDLFGKEKEESIYISFLFPFKSQNFYDWRLATCEEFFVSVEIIILLVLISSNQTYRRLWRFLPLCLLNWCFL